MRRLTLPLLLAAVLLAVACGSSSDEAGTDGGPSTTGADPTTAPEDGAPTLDGRTFVATSITVDGSERPLVEGSELRIDLEDGRLGMSAGCNRMAVGYSIEGATLVTDGEVAGTLMGCEPDLQAQDEWIGELLTRDMDVDLDGDRLVLTADDTVLTLVDATTTPLAEGLVGPTWALDTMVDGDMASSVPAGATATITFAEDGTYGVDTGCNTGSGTYAVDGTTLQVDPPATTRRGCQGDAGMVEQAVLTVLDGPIDARIEDGRLVLTHPGGTSLVFLAP